MDGGGLMEVVGSEHFAEAVGPCSSKLSGLELHEQLFVSGTGSGSISSHAVTLREAKERRIASGRGGVRDEKSFILRNGQIVELARVEVVRAIQRRVRMRTRTACRRDANVLRVIQNRSNRSRLWGWWSWSQVNNRRGNSGSMGLNRLGSANLDWLSIGQTVHPRGILIVFQRRRICRQCPANFLSAANNDCAKQCENRSPLHCWRFVAKATFQILARRQASSAPTMYL